MINKEAIQQIQAGAIASHTAELTEGKAVVIPDCFRLQSLENQQETRNRFRGIFKTTSLSDWLEYIKIYADDNSSEIHIDKDNLSANAIIDLGNYTTPLHCEHKANLKLVKTPIYNAVLTANENAFTQNELVEWLEDWAEHIAISDKDDEAMNLSEAVASIRRIEINASSSKDYEVGESRANLSRSEQIEAKSKGRQISTVRLTCAPYEGLEPIQAEIRLIVLASNTPKIRFRILRLAEIKEIIAQDFKCKIKSEVDEEISVFVGSFSE